jgi:hypothetical protein
VAALKGDNIVL